MKARIGIIGGTGVYDPKMFELKGTVRPNTPYGPASDEIQVGELKGVPVAFLPRHGRGHVIPPHMINYRANIYALKQLGVERIISPCAVGSLQDLSADPRLNHRYPVTRGLLGEEGGALLKAFFRARRGRGGADDGAGG